jgi:VWFA-related protein
VIRLINTLSATWLLSSAVLLAFQASESGERAVPTLKVETRIVQVDVVVTDVKGNPIAGLQKADFTLLDNGKPRRIDVFTVNDGETQPAPPPTPTAPLPPNTFSNRNLPPPVVPSHATVIVIDASPADPIHDLMAFRASKGMALGRVMRMKPDEQIAVYVTSKHTGLILLQTYTGDRELLLKKIREYEQPGLFPGLSPWMVVEPVSQDYRLDGALTDKPSSDPPPPPDPDESPRRSPLFVPARETEGLIDFSVRENRMSLQVLAERLAALPGRKNIFWATIGLPPRLMNGPDWEHTFTALNEANVAVSTATCAPSSTLIAEKTGGAATCADGPSASAVMEGARASYTLGFYLDESERDDTYRSITVKVNRPHAQLFYRQGFFAGKAARALKEKKPELVSVLLTPVQEDAVKLTAGLSKTGGQGTLRIRLTLDAATLSVTEKNSRLTGEVDELIAEFNERGDMVGKVSDTRTFTLPSAKRSSYETHGVTWPIDINLVSAAVKLQIVVRDRKSGRLGSLTIPLQDVK